MANRYVSALASGGGNGSEGNPWTLLEAINAIETMTGWSNGDHLWIKADGIYNLVDTTFTNIASSSNPNRISGYSSIIGDKGKAIIQRNGGGSGNLLAFPNGGFWKIENLILDGQSTGYGIYAGFDYNVLINIEVKNTQFHGFTSSKCINCYAHNNALVGFQWCITQNCISENNTFYGFWRGTSAINCISKNNLQGFSTLGHYYNCISDSDSIGFNISGEGTIAINCIIINAGYYYSHYGIMFNHDPDCAFVSNINFYNCLKNSNYDLDAYGITYYELDPQFNDPDNLDYTRIGTNLDDIGFSKIGLLNRTEDYHIDIGIDQRISADYPDESDVRYGVIFDHGNKTGTSKLLEFPETSFVPRFKLYDSTGNTLLYTFPIVQRTNIPQSPKNIVEHSTVRGKGSIIIEGGDQAWDAEIEGILFGNNYEMVTSKIDELESAIELNIPYILRFDQTETLYWQYKVKRIVPIEYPENLRTDTQRYIIRLRVNSW